MDPRPSLEAVLARAEQMRSAGATYSEIDAALGKGRNWSCYHLRGKADVAASNARSRLGAALSPVAAARRAGAKRYFTGIPCSKGHISERMVSNRRCVACLHEEHAVWALDNLEHRRAVKKAWDLKNAEQIRKKQEAYNALNRDRMRARDRAKRLADPEKYRAYDKKNREKNGERLRAAQRQWRKEHPEEARAARRTRRARIKSVGGKHTPDEISKLFKKQGGKCANTVCRKKISLRRYHADHIIPLARRGHNRISNIQLLCPWCNQSKNALHPLDWAKRQGLLV